MKCLFVPLGTLTAESANNVDIEKDLDSPLRAATLLDKDFTIKPHCS
jgi:hypothetical protein